MLDPYNLWVYNATNAATSELPQGASKDSTGSYTPGPQKDADSPLKLAANSSTGSSATYVDSYVSDSFINEKLTGVEVQLTANGNITVTSNVTIKSNSNNQFQINAGTATGFREFTGNLFINNATIDVKAGIVAMGFGDVSVKNSKIVSEGRVVIGSGRSNGKLSISNSDLSGTSTTVSAISGSIDITGGNVNGTTSVKISASSTNGNATLSGVSVNTPDVNVTGSNITLDNATLNVTPSGADKGIKIGGGYTPAKNVVIKNSTLNTTGSTVGVVNIQDSTVNDAINANGTIT